MPPRLDPPASLRRDSRIAWLSIVGFWTFYFLVNSTRAFILQEPHQVEMLGRRVIVASLSMVITAIFYVFLRGSSAASMRRSMATAAALALPSAIAYGALNFFVFEDISSKSYPAQVHVRPSAPSPTNAGGQPETLNVGHATSEHDMAPWQAIAENSANGYFFFVAWASLFLSLRYAGEVRVLERRSAELRAAAQYAELRALRYQVNPHFLFNTLNSLSSLILTGKGEQAERMILNLATFFRTSLSGDPTEDVSLAEEIALQRLYLDIEAVRFPDRLLVEIDLSETLATAQVPGLILQPLVENAVKHGVSRTVRPVTIAISAQERESRLVLTVANSVGDGPCENGLVHGTGVGLRNVRDRLAARFGDDGRCHWRAPAPGRFEVELTMPIIRNGR
ncbi:MAG: signal transduction histidine kinase [Caulobacteraceae bacterium]|nr:signal transduction histidine kinase [Caulobacteraceae bacterium]